MARGGRGHNIEIKGVEIKSSEASLGHLQWIIDGSWIQISGQEITGPGMTATSEHPLGWSVTADNPGNPAMLTVIASGLADGFSTAAGEPVLSGTYRIRWRGEAKNNDSRKQKIYSATFQVDPAIGQTSITEFRPGLVSVVLFGSTTPDMQWSIITDQGDEVASSNDPLGWNVIVAGDDDGIPAVLEVTVPGGTNAASYRVIWIGRPVAKPGLNELYIGPFQVPIQITQGGPGDVTGARGGLLSESWVITGQGYEYTSASPGGWQVHINQATPNPVTVDVPPNTPIAPPDEAGTPQPAIYEISWRTRRSPERYTGAFHVIPA